MASKQIWHRTLKHELIQRWAQAHSATPARVRSTTDALKLKIGSDERSWETISWDDWLKVFDEKEFAFLYEEPGFSNKIVKRNGTEDGAKPSTE